MRSLVKRRRRRVAPDSYLARPETRGNSCVASPLALTQRSESSGDELRDSRIPDMWGVMNDGSVPMYSGDTSTVGLLHHHRRQQRLRRQTQRRLNNYTDTARAPPKTPPGRHRRAWANRTAHHRCRYEPTQRTSDDHLFPLHKTPRRPFGPEVPEWHFGDHERAGSAGP